MLVFGFVMSDVCSVAGRLEQAIVWRESQIDTTLGWVYVICKWEWSAKGECSVRSDITNLK